MGLRGWKPWSETLRHSSSNPRAQTFQGRSYQPTDWETTQFTFKININMYDIPLFETEVHIYMSYMENFKRKNLSKITE